MSCFRLPRLDRASGTLIVGLTLAVSCGVAMPALGQMSAPTGDGMVTSGARNRTPAALPQRAPAPPALPGAHSGGPALPSQRSPQDMPPTEALFDGVNRGDIEAVRDAIGRGAELNARNILGITATELAIDLGRNDIAFLLLSMRAADRQRPTRGGGQAGAQGGTQAVSAPAARPVRPAPTASAANTRMATPERFYPSGPVAPAPSAGFLGFDERTSSR